MSRIARARRFAYWGKILIASCFAALVVGRCTVEIFFPELVRAGITATSLFLLIPIWSVGGLGVLLSLTGWIMYPRMATELDVDWPTRGDGRYFSTFTRRLACFTTTLLCLAAIALLISPQESEPRWKLGLIAYVVVCVWAFTVYLSSFYSPKQHLATTTFLTLLTPLLAYVLFPVVWPILLLLSRQGPPGDSRGSGRTIDE
jgi:hypothetical protein